MQMSLSLSTPTPPTKTENSRNHCVHQWRGSLQENTEVASSARPGRFLLTNSVVSGEATRGLWQFVFVVRKPGLNFSKNQPLVIKSASRSFGGRCFLCKIILVPAGFPYDHWNTERRKKGRKRGGGIEYQKPLTRILTIGVNRNNFLVD